MPTEPETVSLIVYAAVCSRCGHTGDDDGGEYQGTPELAVAVALRDLGFHRINGRLVCEDCPTEDEVEADDALPVGDDRWGWIK